MEPIDVPDLPEPALSLPDLDSALKREGFVPPGAELAPLGPGSYKLRLPGSDAWVRVTTSAEVFDDHFETHAFLSPGGVLFETPSGTVDWQSAPGASEAGHCWLVELDGEMRQSEL